MSGKWTERGIECEHEPSHLVADKDGVVVCNKRKGQREEISVGKMMVNKFLPQGKYIRERSPIGTALLNKLCIHRPDDPVYIQVTTAIRGDLELSQAVIDLEEANAAVHNANAYAKEMLKKLSKRFRELIYAKGLAAPTIEALHDPKFGCPLHPKSRFLWQADAPIKSTWLPAIFYRHCLECSLNPKSLNEPVRGWTPINAYECEHCGIVLGEMDTKNGPGDLKERVCKLCGTKVGESVSSR